MHRRVNARTLTTKRAVAGEFAHHASPWILAVAIAVPALLRGRLGGRLSRQDAVALAAVAAAQPLVEWALHRHVLHAPARRVGGRLIDPGASHRGHHLTPDDVGGALLGAGYAVADTSLVAAAVAVVGLVTTPLAGGVPVAGTLTAIAAGETGLAAYEWVHLLVHSGYRPRTKRFRRLRAQHHHHHFRDEAASFGITASLGDRAFGTARPRRSVAANVEPPVDAGLRAG